MYLHTTEELTPEPSCRLCEKFQDGEVSGSPFPLHISCLLPGMFLLPYSLKLEVVWGAFGKHSSTFWLVSRVPLDCAPSHAQTSFLPFWELSVGYIYIQRESERDAYMRII